MKTDMTALIFTALAGLKSTGIAALKVGGMTLLPFVAAAASLINENTAIPVSLLFGAISVVWYLQGRFTKIEVNQETTRETLERLEKKIDSRPCAIPELCNPQDWRKHHK